ncbi:MAG TPA: YceI family protein [Rhizomicrobium sp.]|jgi:polyisoprenoid-binding protein YceI|nr:YceI family protein [Rhizomicrobium sp.]
MKRAAISIAILGLLIAPASAAQKWKLETARSKLDFTVSWGGQPFHGVFRSWKADIEFDPADLAHSHANITIDTGSESSGDPETDGGVKGAEGFASSQFPTALFRTSAFTHKAGNDYVAAGTLSIKGVSKPVTLPFTLTLSGNTARVMGKAQVIRTDFRVGTGEWEKPDPVAHEVAVNIDLTATKAGS